MSAQAAYIEKARPQVTSEAVWIALTRLIQAADPAQIVAFGSRARGNARPDSDLDIAVILQDKAGARPPTTKLWALFDDLHLPLDMIVVDASRYKVFSNSVNSVHYSISREGVVLYEKGGNGSPSASAVAFISR